MDYFLKEIGDTLADFGEDIRRASRDGHPKRVLRLQKAMESYLESVSTANFVK